MSPSIAADQVRRLADEHSPGCVVSLDEWREERRQAAIARAVENRHPSAYAMWRDEDGAS